MNDREEMRTQAYQSASPEVRALYGNAVFGNILYAAFLTLGLPEEKYGHFVDTFGDVILNLEQPENITTRLIAYLGITEEQATRVATRVVAETNSPLLSLSPRPITDRAPTQTVPTAQTTPPAAPPPHVPVARVMPHAPGVVKDPRTSTELPNALLQNLKASLMHSVPEEPLEGTNPKPSYNAILDSKPPTPPTPPPK